MTDVVVLALVVYALLGKLADVDRAAARTLDAELAPGLPIGRGS